MANIVPIDEGFVSSEVFEALKDEIRDVVEPLLDGINLLEDGLIIPVEAIELVNEIKGLPDLTRSDKIKVIAAALIGVVNEIVEDLVVVYDDEGFEDDGEE